MDFDSWLQSKGHTGFLPDQVARKLNEQWMKETGGGFQPKIVDVPLPGGTNTVQAFMSSPNVVTNAQGKPIKVDPKSSRLEDLMTIMGEGGVAPQEAQPGLLARIFGGVQSSPAPTPAPAATPAPEATPSAQMVTNASAPVSLRTPEEVRAAYQQGLISKDQAKQMLRGGR
jgi:hypothetical protein